MNRIQVLFSCCSEVIQHYRFYHESFQAPIQSYCQLIEYEVLPLTETKIKMFIEVYVATHEKHLPMPALNQPNWQLVETYLSFLQKLPDMHYLVQNPFILLMGLQALPRLHQQAQLSSNDTVQQWQLMR